jgi:hypothetical protein
MEHSSLMNGYYCDRDVWTHRTLAQLVLVLWYVKFYPNSNNIPKEHTVWMNLTPPVQASSGG